MTKICETCGEPYEARLSKRRFCCYACVQRSLHVEACKRGRKTFSYRYRARLFREHIQRLQGLERITTEDLLATFHAIHASALATKRQGERWQRRLSGAMEAA